MQAGGAGAKHLAMPSGGGSRRGSERISESDSTQKHELEEASETQIYEKVKTLTALVNELTAEKKELEARVKKTIELSQDQLEELHESLEIVTHDNGRLKFENSDFYVRPDEGLSEKERYQQTWVSYGVGPVMSSAVAWRYSDFESMPDVITAIVREEAPLWLEPPQDLAEIERMRAKVGD